MLLIDDAGGARSSSRLGRAARHGVSRLKVKACGERAYRDPGNGFFAKPRFELSGQRPLHWEFWRPAQVWRFLTRAPDLDRRTRRSQLQVSAAAYHDYAGSSGPGSEKTSIDSTFA